MATLTRAASTLKDFFLTTRICKFGLTERNQALGLAVGSG